MSQRSPHLDLGRKVSQPLQSRLHLSDSAETGEEPVVLRSRLRSLEDSEVKSLLRSSSDHIETDATSQELFRRVMDLVNQTQARVLSVTRRNETEKSQVLEDFRTLSDGLWALLFKVKLKNELPGHLRDWIRKTIKLEDEKRTLELEHEDALESLSQEMQRRTKDLQQEIARLQETNTALESQLKALSTQIKAQEARETRSRALHSLQESTVRSSVISLNSSTSSLDMRHSRKSSTSLIDQKILPLREAKAGSRSISPVDRTIHGLKSEVVKYKTQLEACQRERDVLKAWKEQSLKRDFEPDFRQTDYNEQEKKRLTSKALILQHRLNLMLLSVPKFIRVSSTLIKAVKDRDLVTTFENARAELEVLLREHKGETHTRISPVKSMDLRLETLEKENNRLEKELLKEKKRSGDFAEALDLTNKTVEILGGKSLNPVQFMHKIDTELKAARIQIQTLNSDFSELKNTRKTLQFADKSQIQSLFESTISTFSSKFQQISSKIDEKDHSLTRLKNAVLNRLQEQLRALIQVNDLLSHSGHSDDTTIDRLREEKESLETLLTASQEWASGKIQELQGLLDQANAALAESQAQMKDKLTQGIDLQELIAKAETADFVQSQLTTVKTEYEQTLKLLANKSALLTQKEAELTEICYEKQRFEEQNRELLEMDKQRSEDWIAAQESFQRELAEISRKLEETELELRKNAQPTTFDELISKITSLEHENDRLKSDFSLEIEKISRSKATVLEELDNERVKVAGLNRELVARNVHFSENKRKAEKLSADIDSWKKEQEAAKNAMEGLKIKLEKSCKDREEAIKLLSEELLEQQRKFMEVQGENAALLEKLAELESTENTPIPEKTDLEIGKLQAEMRVLQDELKLQRDKNVNLELEIRQISEQHDEETETMKHALVSDHKQMCEQLERKIEVLTTEGTLQREQFEEDLSSMQMECALKVKELQEKVKTVSEELEIEKKGGKKWNQVYNEAVDEITALRDTLLEERKNSEALKMQLVESLDKAEQLLSDVHRLKQENLSLEESLRKQEKMVDLDSEPQLPAGSESMVELQEVLQVYRTPQDTLVETVKRLVEDYERVKKSRGGVVIPRLQLRTGVDSKETQTSPHTSDPVTESADQDTPRQKLFPELLKKRVAAGIQQAKTEELYALHNRIKELERDLEDEVKMKEHAYSQLKVFKEELVQKDLSLQQAALAPGFDHLKDVVMRLLSLIPKDQHRNSAGEALVATTYSLLGLTPSETSDVEQARRSGKKGLLGFLNK